MVLVVHAMSRGIHCGVNNHMQDAEGLYSPTRSYVGLSSSPAGGLSSSPVGGFVRRSRNATGTGRNTAGIGLC